MDHFVVCRLCLCTSESLVDIFEENGERVFTVEETIEELLRFKVTKIDGFPWLACLTCLEKLDCFRLFKRQCIDSKIAFEGRFPMYKCLNEKDSLEERESLKFEEIIDNEIYQVSEKENLRPGGTCKKEIIDGNVAEDASDLWLHYSNAGPDFDGAVKTEADRTNVSNEQVTECFKNEIFIEKVVISDLKMEPCEFEKDASQEVETSDFKELSKTKELNRLSMDEDQNIQTNYFRNLDKMPDIKPNFKCSTGNDDESSAHDRSYIGNEHKGPPFSCCDCWLAFSSAHYLIKHRKFSHGIYYDSNPSKSDGGILSSTQHSTSSSDFVNELPPNEQLLLPIKRVYSNVSSCLMSNSKNADGKEFPGLGKGSSDGDSMQSKENKYGCDICKRFMSSKVELQAHIRAHRAAKPFKCHFCRRSFGLKVCLKRHVRTHIGVRPYECDICHKRFYEGGSLKVHIKIHSGEKPFQCSECDKSFLRKAALKRHQMIHTGEMPFQCPKCGRCFNLSANLKSHLKLHSKENLLECTECEKKFIYRSDFKAHMESHTGLKPYGCGICGKWFTGGNTLTRHMRSHIKDKPFCCKLCNKQFNVSTNLKNHMLSHTGERPFVCPECGKRFSLQGNLKQHLRIHTGDRRFACTDCGKKFMTRAVLKRHLLTLCGTRKCYCKQCGRNYSCKRYLRIHIEKFHPEEIRAVEKHIDECLAAVIDSGVITCTPEKDEIHSNLKDG